VKVLAWDEPGGFGREEGPLAAAVGVFDGLHLGHMRLIEEIFAQDGLRKGVVTFRENPKKTLRPSAFHGDIFTLEQKLDRFSSLGLDVCVLIDFSGDFSKLAGRKFLSLLRDRGDLRFLAVGSDFRCGYRLDTGADEIKSYYADLGVESRLLEPVLWSGHPVSSSRIRKAVVDGRLDDARAMLGRDFELDMRGARRAGSSGSRLRLVPECEQVEPPPGEYEAMAAWGAAMSSVRAVYDGDGWSFESPAGMREAPEALRLVRMVSRG
jgi:riboflavin kinase/FMN adenylyltransferase